MDENSLSQTDGITHLGRLHMHIFQAKGKDVG